MCSLMSCHCTHSFQLHWFIKTIFVIFQYVLCCCLFVLLRASVVFPDKQKPLIIQYFR